MTLDELKALRAAGATLRELAELAGVSSTTVHGWLHNTKAYARSVADYESDLPKKVKTKRKCMCCGAEFGSVGPGNRLCERCRRLSATPFDSPHGVSSLTTPY